MFRTKIFDWTRTLCLVSNAWNQLRAYNLYAHSAKPTILLGKEDREALRRIEFSRDMAMAYVPRMQQALR